MRLFIDSDVVISALLSSGGAAYLLLHRTDLTPIVSSISLNELTVVSKRLQIGQGKLMALVDKRFEVVSIRKGLAHIKRTYSLYVTDCNDAHIVAGAHIAGVNFLISYNLKHFKTGKIKEDLKILVVTPAQFLQYLRSLSLKKN